MVLGLLPGMTAYADDTYTLTVMYGNAEICKVTNYELNVGIGINGGIFQPDFDSFDTVSSSVPNSEVSVAGIFFIFYLHEAGSGTISGEYYTQDGGMVSFQLDVSCVKNVPAGYTVTYRPGEGSYAGGDLPTGKAVKGADDKFTYKIEGYDKHTYKTGDTITVTEDITLTAVWEKKSQESGTQPQRRGGGLSGDLVFFGGSGVDNSWEYIGGGVPQRAYRLSFAPMQGGSAYFLLNSGENGETMNVYPQTTVRVVPTPAPGSRLASIVWSMIDGSASYDITESQTFVMPAMDAVVYVTFQPVA